MTERDLDTERWTHHYEVHQLEAKALELQHVETLRRLDDLNHAHEQAREKEQEFTPREAHEAAMGELKRTLDEIRGTMGITLPREVFEAYIVAQGSREEKAAEVLRREVDAQTRLTLEKYESNAARITELETWRNQQQGVEKTIDRTRVLAFSLVGALASIIGVGLALIVFFATQ